MSIGDWARQRVRPIAVGFGALGATAIAFAVEPTRTTWLPKCPFHFLTGLYCPGCGATRALHELTHGDLVAALHNNALFVAMVPLLVFAWYVWLRFGATRQFQLSTRSGTAVAGLFVAFTVLRNFAPFSFLAPIG